MTQISSIKEVVASGELPPDATELIPLLTNTDGTYLFQEGECWDFKETWPFSYSDDYFFGLARLVCAFQNTEGGMIVFGVDDKTRKGGRTKTIPNLDRFEAAIKQLTGVSPNLGIMRYVDEECGDVDILLVKPKGSYEPPIRFKKNCGKYRANTTWIRKASEVIEAEAPDIPLLYLNQHGDDVATRQPAGQLPASQSTVRDFVGRMETIDLLFKWMAIEDEPRAFLYGKGGSGKSTIAYELLKQVKLNGGGYRLGKCDLIDQVMFLSGKKKYLNVEKQSVEAFSGNDFTSEEELYRAILILGGAASEGVEQEDIDTLKVHIKEFFNNTSCLLVIDDIDTLTTAGHEGGLDFLFSAVVRAKKLSKILYTLRNRPTHSLKSSIEVPGLQGEDLHEFVSTCVHQFGVAPPSKDFIQDHLIKVSEGRPLVIESIIALRRHAGSYDRALEMFDRGSGDDVRQYVFEREWEAIERSSRGREMLACLALYGKPMSFDDLAAVSKLDQSRVRDAIAAVQEMFLQTNDEGADTLFSLGALTQKFVETSAVKLDHYETIKARVENFRRSAYPESPQLARISRELKKAEYDCGKGDWESVKELVWKLNSDRYPPDIRENPRFLAMRGYAETLVSPPNMAAVREDFKAALAMGYAVPIDYVRRWFKAEAATDTAYTSTRDIVDLVGNERRYSLSERAEIRFEHAIFLYNIARAMSVTDPHRSLDRVEESLSDHLEAYYSFHRAKSTLLNRSFTYCRNTGFYFVQRSIFLDDGDRFIDAFLKVVRAPDRWLDPLIEPFQLFLQSEFRKNSIRLDQLNRLISKADLIGKEASKSTSFLWGSNKEQLVDQLGSFRSMAKKTIERLRAAKNS